MRSRRRVLCPDRFCRRGDILQREKRHKENLWRQTPSQSSIPSVVHKSPNAESISWSDLLFHSILPARLLSLSLCVSQPSQLLPQREAHKVLQLLCPALTHFYKLLPLHNIQKGNQGRSGPPAAGTGYSGTSGRCSRCCGDQLHIAGTEGGNLERQGDMEKAQMMWAPSLIAMPKGRWNCNDHCCSTDSQSSQWRYMALKHKLGTCTNCAFEVFSKWPGLAQQLSFHPFPTEQPSSSRAACDRCLLGEYRELSDSQKQYHQYYHQFPKISQNLKTECPHSQCPLAVIWALTWLLLTHLVFQSQLYES